MTGKKIANKTRKNSSQNYPETFPQTKEKAIGTVADVALAAAPATNNANKKVTFKNCVSFTDWIDETNHKNR